MRRSEHTVRNDSLSELATAVSSNRGENSEFGTFQLTDALGVTFEDREPLVFEPGTTVSFYGSRAVLLTTLCNPDYSLAVAKGGAGKLFSYKEPSSEELIENRGTFITWMTESLQLES